MIFTRETGIDIPVERLWPVFSDTERMNRALGFAPVRYDAPPPGALVRTSRSILLGILPAAWLEPPYEFIENRYHLIRREMLGGPIRRYAFSLRLHPEGGRSRR